MKTRTYNDNIVLSLNEAEADIMQMDMNYQLTKTADARNRVKAAYREHSINRGEYNRRMRYFYKCERMYRDINDALHAFINKQQSSK